MFINAIKTNKEYTRPLYGGIKLLGSDNIISSISTYIVVNDEGWILTCKHVAEQIINSENLKDLFMEYKTIQNEKELQQFKQKYGITDDDIISQINVFVNTFEGGHISKIILSKDLDIALIKWEDFENISVTEYPKFSNSTPEIGQSVCKLGFAFIEDDYFYYDSTSKEIKKYKEKDLNVPFFPLDGIVTRHINISDKENAMFETSTPGIRGQSGGPIFDESGTILGMQSATRHLDLMFDINGTCKRGLNIEEVHEKQFINLGIAISSKELTAFMDANNVKYNK